MRSPREVESTVARALRARGAAAWRDDPARQVIVDSWWRCLDAGLDFGMRPRIDVVGEAQLQRRREQAEPLRRVALGELETLFQQIDDTDLLLALADRDGVVLDICADPRFAAGPASDVRVGSHWTEQVAGTNGLGVALATGQSVAVNGPEHFFAQFGHITCTASPIRDASGAIVGVLDASMRFESRQRHTQALVRMAAAQIEHRLFVQERQADVLLAVHPRPELLRTLSAGLLAFDRDGRLTAFDARAEALLPDAELAAGRSFDAMFDASFPGFLSRLRACGEAALRGAAGSPIAACWIHPLAPLGRGRGAATPTPATAPPAATPTPVADDPVVRRAMATVAEAVQLRATVLLRGETGTGKALLARQAHAASGRRGPFVVVACAELPAERCEAALFGYVGGAFPGARREGHGGLIASAEGGTLLLDEVSRLALPVQAALLRFLDDSMVRPVGAVEARPVDVQLLAATNADLDSETAAGRFRSDLLFRLGTVCVEVPPLRRRGDFAACAIAVLGAVDARASITRQAIERLARHDWPGNFRELRAVLTRALMLHPTRCLDVHDVEPLLARAAVPPRAPAPCGEGSVLRRGATDAVLEQWRRSGGNVAATSRELGISRTTVYRHLRAAGHPPPDSAGPSGG